MFTMIRIMINRPPVDARRRPQPQPIMEPVDHSDDVKPGNPWKQELDRLSQVSDRSGRSRFGNLQSSANAPQPAAQPVQPSMSEGTLTKLRNWWGSGLNSSNSANSSQQSRQFPPKKVNRWQQ
jgi:hypothetical protein